MATILVVDDDRAIRNLLCVEIEQRGHTAVPAATGLEAIQLGLSRRPDAALLDRVLPDPDLDGCRVAAELRRALPDLVCVIFTAYPSYDTALDCGRNGIARYLQKPMRPAKVASLLDEELAHAGIGTGRAAPPVASLAFHGMIGESDVMRKVFDLIRRVADLPHAVLIDGETGTGKELTARAIHDESPRRHGPFVPVNCSAIQETLFESLVFGHERGAFTGADRPHAGHFEQAHGGSLFLDEIGEVPIHLQARFLRVLEDGSVTRLGGSQAIPVDVRVIAATNRPLAELVEAGGFRADLRHRLNSLAVSLPAVRDRAGDAALLIDHHFALARAELHRPDVTLSTEARLLLAGYRWPGNVREIEYRLRALLLDAAAGTIGPADLPTDLRAGDLGAQPGDFVLPPDVTLDQLRQQLGARLEPLWIGAALRETGGSRSQAARRLGVHRRTLERLIAHHGLTAAQRP
jgi:DNA-binding NtrC family response regulator